MEKIKDGGDSCFRDISRTSVKQSVPDPPITASLRDARAVIEKGNCANWGQLPDFTQKNDKFGLGFTTEAQRAVRKEKIRKAPVFITSPRVNAIEEDVEEAEFDSWIYPTTSNGPSNWTTKDFTSITFVTQ